MGRQGLKSTKETPNDTYLEDTIENNVFFCTTVDPSTTKEGKIYSYLCRHIPTTSIRGNKYIYLMCTYYCNAILTTEMDNISDKYMIRSFTSLVEHLNI